MTVPCNVGQIVSDAEEVDAVIWRSRGVSFSVAQGAPGGTSWCSAPLFQRLQTRPLLLKPDLGAAIFSSRSDPDLPRGGSGSRAGDGGALGAIGGEGEGQQGGEGAEDAERQQRGLNPDRVGQAAGDRDADAAGDEAEA